MTAKSSAKTIDRVAAALPGIGRSLTQDADGCWSFQPIDTDSLQGFARLDGSWLLLNWNPVGRSQAHPWALGESWEALQDTVSGWPLVKPVPFHANGFRLGLQTEIQAATEGELEPVLHRACVAAAQVAGASSSSMSRKLPSPAAAKGDPRPDLDLFRETCREAGWEIGDRERGPVVRLDVPGGFHAAVLAPCTEGLLLRLEVLSGPPPSSTACKAMASFLFRVNRTFRLVRATVTESSDDVSVHLESLIGHGRIEQYACAVLSSLSVACRGCASEVRALRNGSVAGAYLDSLAKQESEVGAQSESEQHVTPGREVKR